MASAELVGAQVQVQHGDAKVLACPGRPVTPEGVLKCVGESHHDDLGLAGVGSDGRPERGHGVVLDDGALGLRARRAKECKCSIELLGRCRRSSRGLWLPAENVVERRPELAEAEVVDERDQQVAFRVRWDEHVVARIVRVQGHDVLDVGGAEAVLGQNHDAHAHRRSLAVRRIFAHDPTMARVDEVAVTGRVVVVAGGTGVVGGAVVDLLLASGARVVVPTRSSTARVPDGARRVVVTDWAEPEALRAVLDEPGWAADAAVAAVGGWWKGADLVDLGIEEWRLLLESHLTSHFLIARAILPLLGGADPAYVTLNGAAAEEAMAGSGPVSVTGAGQAMLLDVLRAEAIGRRVRLHEVRVMHAVAGDDRNEDPASTAAPMDVALAVVATLDDRACPARVHL